MSVNSSTISTQKNYPPQVSDDISYPSTVEDYMPEGIIHFLLSVNLASTLLAYFSNRKDVKIFGNLMIYYVEGNPKKFISPDIMICFGLENAPTQVYKLWEEKVVPGVIIEIASPTTWKEDLYRKYDLYERLGVKEYYIFDVERGFMPQPLFAFHLKNGVFETIKIEQNRVFSPALGLELVDTGETLRLFNPKTNEILMTTEEMAAELERLKQQK